MKRIISLALLILLSPAEGLIGADQVDARLRETLRNTMIQLRSAEAERANLQIAKEELEQKTKALEEQVAKITKQLAADKEAADKSIGELHARAELSNAELATQKQAIEKLHLQLQQASELAVTRENQRAKFANDVIVLQRRVADQQRKNAEMFRIGNEILGKFEKFSLGEAIIAREPFTGLSRVKLQELFQTYGDSLEDSRIKPLPKK